MLPAPFDQRTVWIEPRSRVTIVSNAHAIVTLLAQSRVKPVCCLINVSNVPLSRVSKRHNDPRLWKQSQRSANQNARLVLCVVGQNQTVKLQNILNVLNAANPDAQRARWRRPVGDNADQSLVVKQAVGMADRRHPLGIVLMQHPLLAFPRLNFIHRDQQMISSV